MSPEELSEIYFDWLLLDCFNSRADRSEYIGVLSILHDTPFYWTIWSDSNRAGDALSYRQYDFLGQFDDLSGFDQAWLDQWAKAAPSVLEVLLGIARRWSYFYEEPTSYYFNGLFTNLSLDKFVGGRLSASSQVAVRDILEGWLSRSFRRDGIGSPFPLDLTRTLDVLDMRQLDIWSQMSAYSSINFQ